MSPSESKTVSRKAGTPPWRSWLVPPVFESDAATERARLLHWVLGWSLLLFVILGPIITVFSEFDGEVIAVQLASLATIVGGLVIVRRSVDVAGAVVSLLAWSLQTVAVWVNGVSASTLGGYVLTVVIIGIFWDGRRAVWGAVASCLTVLGFAWAETTGVMPPRPERPVMIAAVEASLQIMIVLTLLGAGLRSLRMSQERVRREARRHARLVARSPDGIFELDARGVIGAFNPAAERLTGRLASEVRGKRLWDLGLVSKEDRVRGRRHLEQVWARGGDAPFEIAVINARGEEVPVEVFPRRVVRADGSVGLMATCRDLRPRRSIEQERAALEEMLQRSRHLESVGRLAGGVAHDFNNLLTVMLSNTQLLLDSDGSGAHWRDDVEQIQAAARKASDLTQQLLAFARRETLEPQVMDINEPLTGLRDLLGRLCGDAVRIEYELGERLPLAKLDRTRFEQIVLNLAANARDAMPDGGQLLVRTSRFDVRPSDADGARSMPVGRYVWLRVQDDGVGMDEHTLAHIFEPFFTTRRGQGGTGLGLATVHGIVSQSSGVVFVESTPGEGTSFDIFFPEAGESMELSSGRWDTRPRMEPARATILLVEDEPVSGRITTRVLEDGGYEVLWGQSVEEAREIWRARGDDIDLLLSDVVMPDGLGPDLARELTQQRPGLDVVYISGFDDEALGDSFSSEGSSLTLVRKPFSIRGLLEQVGDVLEGAPRVSGRLTRPETTSRIDDATK